MNTVVEVTELEVINWQVGVTAQVRKRVRGTGYGTRAHNRRAVWCLPLVARLDTGRYSSACSLLHLNSAPSDYWLLSEINLPSEIKVGIQMRLICVRFTVGARFPAIPLCSSLRVPPSSVCGTNMTQKRGWKAASEVRLWDTAASGLVVFLLPLGSLTQGRASCHVVSSSVEGPASEDPGPPASRRCWQPSEAFRRAGPGRHLDGDPCETLNLNHPLKLFGILRTC